jgi:Zn-dependent M28 family amino/carboxypeptidase
MNNIVVRLIPRRAKDNGNFTPSPNVLLLSAHYDTVPLSQGVYDDSTGVVTLIELLNVLSKSSWV